MIKHITALTTVIFLVLFSNAQYCTSVGNCTDNDFIEDFDFHTISNTGTQGTNCGSRFNPGSAYSNTGQRATVTQGVKYKMRVASGSTRNREQGFAIWIDLNRDNDFDDPGEFVWNSPIADTAFNDSILIPYSAQPGLTRMRVRSTRNSTFTATESCTRVVRGETEDYLLDVRAAQIAPLTDFRANTTFTCDGTVKFTDLTPNQVTNYLWEFGDGDTSTLQNPTHTYTTNGTFTVKLTALNSFGSQLETKTNYITFNASGLKAANCTPTCSSPNAGFGVTDFSFTSISNASNDATSGFEDLSCIQGAASQGVIYQMTASALNAPANQAFRAWIDYNNDGVFSNSTELVLDETDTKSTTVNIRIPSNVVLNTALRIRVAGVYTLSAPATSNFNACANLTYGQMEDYGIVISLNNAAPQAEFEAENTKSCDGRVVFEDLSTNVPTSWNWEFGDGNTSTLQHPIHTYTSSGSFEVKLTSSNLYGTNDITKTGYITVALADAVKSTCSPSTNSHREDYGIHSVLFESINNKTEDGRVGYEDFSCSNQVRVEDGKTYNIEIKTGSKNLEDVYVWIDYNNDGLLDPNTEQAFYSGSDSSHSGTITISSASVKWKSLRMRIMSDILGTNPNACTNPTYGQAEDYAIIIEGDTTVGPQAPSAAFQSDSVQSCLGLIKFTDNSTNSPSTWSWDFGDGKTSTIKNPTHQYSAPGIYTVKLTASNSIGSDLVTKTSLIEVDEKFCIPGNKDPLDIANELSEKGISVYPNPAKNFITLSIPNSSVNKIEVAIISVQGQILFLDKYAPETDFSVNIDINEFSKGVHFIQVTMGENSFSKKLIIK